MTHVRSFIRMTSIKSHYILKYRTFYKQGLGRGRRIMFKGWRDQKYNLAIAREGAPSFLWNLLWTPQIASFILKLKKWDYSTFLSQWKCFNCLSCKERGRKEHYTPGQWESFAITITCSGISDRVEHITALIALKCAELWGVDVRAGFELDMKLPSI